MRRQQSTAFFPRRFWTRRASFGHERRHSLDDSERRSRGGGDNAYGGDSAAFPGVNKFGADFKGGGGGGRSGEDDNIRKDTFKLEITGKPRC